MLGVKGAKLKFEFQIVDRTLAGQVRKSPGTIKSKAKSWMRGLLCGHVDVDDGIRKREDSAIELETMDDHVRSHAVVPPERR